ncbi:MAG: serine/threonine transporter SstT [Kurthia sp.]|nr:serine/threonine transporter SstT [Candidatus Kurthia equi]
MRSLIQKWNSLSLVVRILCGIVVGIILAVAVPELTWLSMLGTLFISALKAVAPILVFVLVINALASHRSGKKTNMKTIIMLYVVGTFVAGFVGVLTAKLFPITLSLKPSETELTPPSGIGEVFEKLLTNIFANPVEALMSANYIGILAWAIILGFALKASSDTTKTVLSNLSDGITKVVQWIIALAPFGIIGIMYDAIVTSGFGELKKYGSLIILLVGCMLFIALVINPLIVWIVARRNPYPLVLTSLKESGITAFFTRSSAANIPVNIKLCEKLGLDKNTYSVSIPLGATINMGGAAVTISVLTMVAAHTLNVEVDIPTAVILMVITTISAAGASGVTGGSLLLIPLACGLLGIPNDIAMQVVGVGLIIGVVQDSCETALNSSSDIVFTAAAQYADELKNKK